MQRVKPRRLRKSEVIRDWVKETHLHPKNIILPYFVVEGEKAKEPIKSIGGVYHLDLRRIFYPLRILSKTWKGS